MIEMNCPTCGKILRIPISYRGTTGRCNGCGDPVFVPLDAIPRAQVLGHGTTEIPPDLPEEIPISSPRPLPQNEALNIDMAISQREMANAQRDTALAIRQQTTTHKIACGCLLLVLTAPLWIPVLVFLFSLAVAMGTTVAAALLAPSPGNDNPVQSEVSTEAGEVFPSGPDTSGESVESTTIVVQAPAPLPVTTAVYSDEMYYHLDRKCAAISSDPVTSTLSLALSRAKQPCLVCAPDQPPNRVQAPVVPKTLPKALATISDAPTEPPNAGEVPESDKVFVGQIGERYHREKCPELHGIIGSMSLPKALAKGLTACPKCRPRK